MFAVAAQDNQKRRCRRWNERRFGCGNCAGFGRRTGVIAEKLKVEDQMFYVRVHKNQLRGTHREARPP